MNPIFPLLASALLSICLGYPASIIARKFKLIDIPGSAPHKTHKYPTPLAGGLLIALTLVACNIIFYSRTNQSILAMMAGAAIIFLFGIWDDRKGLSAGPKLLGQFLAVGILISQGVQVHFIDTLFRAGYISWVAAQTANVLITFFWLIGITNAVNMIDSMDGIVAGLGMIASVCFLFAATSSNQGILSVWSAVLLGVCVGLYFWNKLLGKIFLGDSGSQTVGFLLATLGILYNPQNLHPESSWLFPIMLLGIPIFDTSLVVLSRLKRKHPVGTGRRDHTYHRLIALGFSPKTAVLTTHFAALLVSGLAFWTLFLSPATAIALFFTTVFFGILILIWFERKPTLDIETLKDGS